MVKKSTLKAVTFMKDKLLQTGLNVQKIIVFGSQANGKYNENSDIDIMVELDPKAPIGVYEYVAITHFIGDLFPRPVDVAERAALKSYVLPAAERDAKDTFM